jgi:hypothetical protein
MAGCRATEWQGPKYAWTPPMFASREPGWRERGLDSFPEPFYRTQTLPSWGMSMMIRAAFTYFLGFLLLISWVDDIYLGSQTPDDPSDDFCFSENDVYLPCKVQKTPFDDSEALPFCGSVPCLEWTLMFPVFDTRCLTQFWFGYFGTSLRYVFMSLQR